MLLTRHGTGYMDLSPEEDEVVSEYKREFLSAEAEKVAIQWMIDNPEAPTSPLTPHSPISESAFLPWDRQ